MTALWPPPVEFVAMLPGENLVWQTAVWGGSTILFVNPDHPVHVARDGKLYRIVGEEWEEVQHGPLTKC